MLAKLFKQTTSRYLFSSKGFQALNNAEVQSQVVKSQTDKLDALIQVIQSLNQKQLSYLNQLQTKKAIQNGQSVISNKIVSSDGTKYSPLQFAYQEKWIKKNWKDSHLLTTVVIPEDEQQAKEQEQVVKQIWQIELTSVEASQKIKIIKVLRQMFSLGLKEAKQIADKTPSIIKRERKDEADKVKEILQKQGCVITLK